MTEKNYNSKEKPALVLASSSQFRLAVCHKVGLQVYTYSPDIEEILAPNEAPEDYVVRLAREKAQAVADRIKNDRAFEEYPDIWVIGCDIIGVCHNRVYEKPANRLEQNACATPLLSEAGQSSSRLLADIFID